MIGTKLKEVSRWLEQLAQNATQWAGSSWAFLIAAALVIIWLTTGPIFGFSDTWQLVMNTVSSIVTFLMVFLIQRSQNKDALAMQMKLSEIVAVLKGASNRLIDVEDLNEEEMHKLHKRYQELAELAKNEENRNDSTSVEHLENQEESGQKSESKA
jgi:low affinity Fe/Cu permease